MSRAALLLINLGTPDAPETPAVRRYLREFLSDPRVIDLAAWKRSLLLNAVILPFRPGRSAAAYQLIWTERGSPLLFHGQDLAAALQERLGDAVQVELAMRYGRPSIAAAVQALQAAGIDRVVALPLFPQYASSSWGSAVQELYAQAGRLTNTPSVQVLDSFYADPGYIEAFAQVTRPVLDELAPDRVLMSFHGLPERHMRQSDLSRGEHCLKRDDCCAAVREVNRYCYRAQSYATARALAAALGLTDASYEVAFQSRLGRDPWIQPFTDVRVRELAQEGVRRLAVVVPSFVADCLETLEEIAMRAREDFVAHGGEELRLVPSLNAHPAWVDAILAMLREQTTLEVPAGSSGPSAVGAQG